MSIIRTSQGPPGSLVRAAVALPSVRRLRRRTGLVALVVVLGLVVGALTGYLAFRVSGDGFARGRAADAARWQAQADAYLGSEATSVRGRAADAARWRAQAEAYEGPGAALARGRAADAARLQAMAGTDMGGQMALERGLAADAARWEAMAEAHFAPGS